MRLSPAELSLIKELKLKAELAHARAETADLLVKYQMQVVLTRLGIGFNHAVEVNPETGEIKMIQGVSEGP